MSNFKNLGGLALLSDAHAPKTFSKKNLRKIPKIYLLILNFENYSH